MQSGYGGVDVAHLHVPTGTLRTMSQRQLYRPTEEARQKTPMKMNTAEKHNVRNTADLELISASTLHESASYRVHSSQTAARDASHTHTLTGASCLPSTAYPSSQTLRNGYSHCD